MEVTTGLFYFFVVVGWRGGAGSVARPAFACSVFPCHPAVTFHLLATEQKHPGGTLQRGGGSDFRHRLQGLNDRRSDTSVFVVSKRLYGVLIKRVFSVEKENLIRCTHDEMGHLTALVMT